MNLLRTVIVAALGRLAVATWLFANVASGQSAMPEPPAETSQTYVDAGGTPHVYLVQEPATRPLASDTPILIYMHGGGGWEEQGMKTLFPGLRSLLSKWGWIYVCPRDYEYDGLRQALTARYGRRPLVLAGASAGGGSALREALREPSAYSGLILMCPSAVKATISSRFTSETDPLRMPVWMICGERDFYSAETCRFIDESMTQRGRRVHYEQIPGGDHDDPCKQIRWEAALRFVVLPARMMQ